MMVVEKLKQMNITPDAITTTVQFHWASALVVFFSFFFSPIGPWFVFFFLCFSSIAQCAVCKVRCHCIFYGPGIRYSDIFGAPGIRYSVIIKLPCALLQTGHLETVHAPVADTVAYFADLDAPVVDTVTYFGGNHR